MKSRFELPSECLPMIVPPPSLGRRSLLGMAVLGASWAVWPTEASSADAGQAGAKPHGAGNHAQPADLALLCEPTLATAMRLAASVYADRGNPRTAIFSAPPALLLAEIAHGVSDDLLVTTTGAMDSAIAQGLASAQTRADLWSNRVVLAGPAGRTTAFAAGDGVALRHAFAGTGIAVPDPTDASTIDGPAVLARLGLNDTPSQTIVGAADTAGVAYLIKTGAVGLGLLYLTDVRADPTLALACVLDASTAPAATYSIALSAKTKNPHAPAFHALLRAPDLQPQLQSLGLVAL